MYFIKSILNNGMQEEVSQFFAFAAFSIEAKKNHRKSSQNDYYEIFYKYYEMFYKCVWMLEIGSSGLLLASV